MNCAEIYSNLEAYALGALDPETHSRIERHLLECDMCRRAAHQYAIVAHTLPDALAKSSTLVPPASMKQNVMAAVQAEVRGHAAAPARAPRQPVPAPVAARRRTLLNPRVWTFALGVSMVVILALMGFLAVTHLQLQEAITNETAALEQVHTYRLSEDARTVLTRLSNPEQVPMTPSNPGSNVNGTLTFDSRKPYIVFQAYNLPQPELGKQYYLWTMNEGRMQLVARFTPKPNGEIQVSFSVDREYPVLKRVILTRQISIRDIATGEFPSNDTILEWDSIRSRTETQW